MENKKILLLIISIIIVSIVGYFIFIGELNNSNTNTNVDEEIQEHQVKENRIIRYSEEFEEMLVDLKTSDNIIKLVNDNFEYNYRDGDEAVSSEELFESKKGGPQDLATFVAYALNQNNYISFIFVYEDESNTYYAVSFRDDDLPKYVYFDKDGAHMIHHGWFFMDLCKKEEERLNIKILRYGTVSPRVVELIPNEWVNY